MSTKAIRMVLGEMKKTHDWLMIDEAFQELEAIERAAKAIEAWQSAPVTTSEEKQRLSKDASTALDVLSAIAKDAP